MTDIQFLINLIINYNLTEDAKKLCLERIGEIEARNAKPNPPIHQSYQPGISAAQQKYMDEVQSLPQSTGTQLPPANLINQVKQTQEMISSNGLTSIKGPNKMRGRL